MLRRALIVVALLLALTASACRKGEDTPKTAPAAAEPAPADGPGSEGWPARPADGAPVAVQFVALTKAGDDLRARMKVFNFGDKAVRGVHLELEYIGADGQVLKAMPWSQVAPTLVDARAQAEHEMGAFIPAETASVRALVRRVELGDGTDWRPVEATAP